MVAVRQAAAQDVGRVLRAHRVGQRHGQEAVHQAGVVEVGQRAEEAQLLLRRLGLLEAVDEAVELLGAARGRHDVDGRGQQARIDAAGLGLGWSNRSAANARAVSSAPRIPRASSSVPRSSRSRSRSPSIGSVPRRSNAGCTRSRTMACRRLARCAVDEPVDRDQAADDPLPHREVGLAAEALDDVEEVDGAHVAGQHRRPTCRRRGRSARWARASSGSAVSAFERSGV